MINFKKILLLNILLIITLLVFINSNNFLITFVKLFYVFLLPGGALLCFTKKDKESLPEFIFKSFLVNLICLVVFTVLVKYFWAPLTISKLYAVNIILSLVLIVFLPVGRLNSIRITRSGIKSIAISTFFLILSMVLFKSYLFSSLENMGSLFYRNEDYSFQKNKIRSDYYSFGDVWDIKDRIYHLNAKEVGRIYFSTLSDQNGFIDVSLAIKGKVGSSVS
ncbi:MAG: hypothetical protein PHQ54_01745, partial [Candidatus Omnitrophica bacterium]|nr:hypothetical protein [Candidatus Omnitrophota bacterium]